MTAIEKGRRLAADLSAETLRVTTLGERRAGDSVNLERALEWRGRVSGHFVLGHVDAVSKILAIEEASGSWVYRFSIPRGLGRKRSKELVEDHSEPSLVQWGDVVDPADRQRRVGVLLVNQKSEISGPGTGGELVL